MKDYGSLVLRIAIGMLFVPVGLMRLFNPGEFIGQLQAVGMPAPSFVAWTVLLSEIIFGTCVFVGWKVKYAIWPLIAIMIGAILFVFLPGFGLNVGSWIMTFLHVIVIGALLSLFFTGPGKFGVKDS